MKTVEFVEVTFRAGARSRPLVVWCEQNLGELGRDWDFTFSTISTISQSRAIFEFARAEDATLFALKWSEYCG